MKNNTSGKAHRGNARIAERYKNDNWNVAKAGVARAGMTIGEVCVVRKADGQSVIFTCRAAMPECVSDQAAQAALDNSSLRIVLASENNLAFPLNKDRSHD
jgi:hypothetical protein